MKIKNIFKIAACTLALTSLLCSCANQTISPGSKNLMNGVEPTKLTIESDSLQNNNIAVTDFSIRLFNNCFEGKENTLISPLSVLSALSMVTNGADNKTLKQLEETIGIPSDKLNDYFYNFMQVLDEDEEKSLKLANSIWFRDAEFLNISKEFLQTNADYYGADIYKAPFDNTTLNDINCWVSDNTDKMIPEMLTNIPADAVMYLVNALAFSSEWDEPYEKNQIKELQFNNFTGKTTYHDFLCSTESIYLEDDYATGFMKRYKNGKYAFVALLPNENVTVAEYAEKLTADNLNKMLTKPEFCSVITKLPKFKTEYDISMNDTLINMGIVDAFNPLDADFTKLGVSDRGNISISNIIHKTFISVDEKGTKAGAATVIQMDNKSSADIIDKPKVVTLDRPFIYMLVDFKTKTPFFIGALMDV